MRPLRGTSTSAGLVRPRPPGARGVGGMLDAWLDRIAPCPWVVAGGSSVTIDWQPVQPHQPLYTPEQRRRRDATGWTLVQGVLAPVQFAIFLVSLGLVLNYLATGHGYAIASASVVLKTAALYAIMITGAIWEKKVFGQFLFAPAFLWEDVVSILVLALHSTYLAVFVLGVGSAQGQMWLAVAAYASYVLNATQFLLKLRSARLEAADRSSASIGGFAAGSSR